MTSIIFLYSFVLNVRMVQELAEHDVEFTPFSEKCSDMLDAIIAIGNTDAVETSMQRLKEYYTSKNSSNEREEDLLDNKVSNTESFLDIRRDTTTERRLLTNTAQMGDLNTIPHDFFGLVTEEYGGYTGIDGLVLIYQIIQYKLGHVMYLLQLYGLLDEHDAKLKKFTDDLPAEERKASTEEFLQLHSTSLNQFFQKWIEETTHKKEQIHAKALDYKDSIVDRKPRFFSNDYQEIKDVHLQKNVDEVMEYWKFVGQIFKSLSNLSLGNYSEGFITDIFSYIQILLKYGNFGAKMIEIQTNNLLNAEWYWSRKKIEQYNFEALHKSLNKLTETYNDTWDEILYTTNAIRVRYSERNCDDKLQTPNFTAEIADIERRYRAVSSRIMTKISNSRYLYPRRYDEVVIEDELSPEALLIAKVHKLFLSICGVVLAYFVAKQFSQ